MRAKEYNIFKKIEVSTDLDGKQIMFNVVDIDIASGKYAGFYSEIDKYGECLLGGYSMVNDTALTLRNVR